MKALGTQRKTFPFLRAAVAIVHRVHDQLALALSQTKPSRKNNPRKILHIFFYKKNLLCSYPGAEGRAAVPSGPEVQSWVWGASAALPVESGGVLSPSAGHVPQQNNVSGSLSGLKVSKYVCALVFCTHAFANLKRNMQHHRFNVLLVQPSNHSHSSNSVFLKFSTTCRYISWWFCRAVRLSLTESDSREALSSDGLPQQHRWEPTHRSWPWTLDDSPLWGRWSFLINGGTRTLYILLIASSACMPRSRLVIEVALFMSRVLFMSHLAIRQ